MSGLLALFGPDAAGRTEAVSRAWERITAHAGDDAALDAEGVRVLGVARPGWQSRADLAGRSLVVWEDGVGVVADATLYGLGELRSALAARGRMPRGPDAAHLILAAYAAWGDDLVDHLTGDYAFVVVDAARGRLLAARDPVGTRPLFHAERDGVVGLSSSSRALALWRGTETELNLPCLGALVAGTLFSMGTDTVYEGVSVVRPGFVLTREGASTRTRRFWSPPRAPDPRPRPLAEAAEAFRELLARVVDEQMGAASSSVWMSGGWDSTAVFGAGRAVLEGGGPSGRTLRPVSIRFPEGDPGHEDPWIVSTAGRWDAEVEWIESESIDLLTDLPRAAARADEPPPHLYEAWNVALARGSRRVGAHVALTGNGGDNAFQVSDVTIADDLRRGRAVSAARKAWARRAFGWRHLVRHGVLPLVPRGALRGVERLTGRNVPRHHLELGRTPWVPDEAVRRLRLRERDLAILDEMAGATHAQSETMLFVSLPGLAWGGSYMRGVLLGEGVEVRSPLLDPRIVEFALRRPVSDRAAGAETKRLLRRAVRGWVPDDVLAPRTHRTGVSWGYSARQMRAAYPALLDRLFAEPLHVERLGLVDPRGLADAAAAWRAGRAEHVRTQLFNTMRVEFWLRGALGG